jgi:hypothetical protein
MPMPQVRFESVTPVFERAKTVHALDRAATVIGPTRTLLQQIYRQTTITLHHTKNLLA